MAKRHHYVPRFYLEHFVDPKSGKLWVSDFKEKTNYSTYPKNAAVIGQYYRTRDDPDRIESWLSQIEGNAAADYDYVIGSGSVASIPEAITRFIAVLGARVPWTRRAAQEYYETYIQNAALGIESLPEAPDYECTVEHRENGERKRLDWQLARELLLSRDWKAVLDQDQHVDVLLVQCRQFTDSLSKLSWRRLRAPNNQAFITSDRPLVWYVSGRNVSDSPAALKHPKVEVYVPMAYNTALYGVGHAVKVSPFSAAKVNRHLIEQAERFIFSRDEPTDLSDKSFQRE